MSFLDNIINGASKYVNYLQQPERYGEYFDKVANIVAEDRLQDEFGQKYSEDYTDEATAKVQLYEPYMYNYDSNDNKIGFAQVPAVQNPVVRDARASLVGFPERQPNDGYNCATLMGRIFVDVPGIGGKINVDDIINGARAYGLVEEPYEGREPMRPGDIGVYDNGLHMFMMGENGSILQAGVSGGGGYETLNPDAILGTQAYASPGIIIRTSRLANRERPENYEELQKAFDNKIWGSHYGKAKQKEKDLLTAFDWYKRRQDPKHKDYWWQNKYSDELYEAFKNAQRTRDYEKQEWERWR